MMIQHPTKTTFYGRESASPSLPHTVARRVFPDLRAEQQRAILVQRTHPTNTTHARMDTAPELLAYQSLPSARDTRCGHGRLEPVQARGAITP